MKTTRLRYINPIIRSRPEAEALIREISLLILERNSEQIELDGHITTIRSKYEETLTDLSKRIDEKTEVARAWAEANPSEFHGAKSLDMTHAVIGWRTGQPTLKTIAGWTWDRVLEKIKTVKGWATYIRTKEEVNKQLLIADRESLGADVLRDAGLKIVQDEAFFIEPKLQEQENRQIA